MNDDMQLLRSSAPFTSIGGGLLGKSYGSTFVGGILPNRSGLSSAGGVTSGLGMPRHGSNNYGMSTTNTMMSTNSASQNTQGVELYYKRRTGSAQQRHRNKAGAFNRGGSKPQPHLGVIQNTQNSLLASLGAERAQLNTGLVFSLNDGAPPQPTEPTLQLPRSSSAAGAPASTYTNSADAAAAAAQAIVMQAKLASPSIDVLKIQYAREGKKNVRWSDNLTKCSPERSGDPSTHQYTSILAVGGKVNVGGTATPVVTSKNNTGANTGIGGLGGGESTSGKLKINPSNVQSQSIEVVCAKASTSIEASARTVKTHVPNVVSVTPVAAVSSKVQSNASLPLSKDSAAAFIHSASSRSLGLKDNASVVSSNNRDDSNSRLLQECRPHTSDNANVDSQRAPRHRALLEMRRNGGNNGSGERAPSSRPSLSEQLAAITASAGALTASIRATAGMDNAGDIQDPPIVVLPARSFSVGTLSCRYPSPVRFYRNRLEYTFHHPFEASEILMTMHYSDMATSHLNAGKLKFKLPRRLTHFPADFNPNNPSHAITIELGTTAAHNIVREKVMPLITGSGSGMSMPRR